MAKTAKAPDAQAANQVVSKVKAPALNAKIAVATTN